MFTTVAELQLEASRRNRAFFAARRDGKTIEEATELVNERELYALESDGEVFEEGNGGRWQTSGGMQVFVKHNPTRYVKLPSGEVRFASKTL